MTQVWHEGECHTLQCGSGQQRVAWIARVAAQRFGSGGVWCPADKVVGRPKEYIPGRVFSYPHGEELDGEATISSLHEAEEDEHGELAFAVELTDTPAKGLPSLAAKGSEDSVIPPKNSKAAISYQVSRESKGFVVRRTPAPMPEEHNGFDFVEVMNGVDFSDLVAGVDPMVIAATRNVLSNSFAALVDIFLHYARDRPVPNQPEETEMVINMMSLSTFVRTCRLSSEACSFFEIQRAVVRPDVLDPQPQDEEEFPARLYDAGFSLAGFFEALVRLAHLKNYGLSAICDQLNKLIHTQASPCSRPLALSLSLHSPCVPLLFLCLTLLLPPAATPCVACRSCRTPLGTTMIRFETEYSSHT